MQVSLVSMDQVRGSYKQLSMSSVPSNDREATTTIGTDIVVAVVDG